MSDHPAFHDCTAHFDDPYADHTHVCDLTASHTGTHACDCGIHWCGLDTCDFDDCEEHR